MELHDAVKAVWSDFKRAVWKRTGTGEGGNLQKSLKKPPRWCRTYWTSFSITRLDPSGPQMRREIRSLGWSEDSLRWRRPTCTLYSFRSGTLVTTGTRVQSSKTTSDCKKVTHKQRGNFRCRSAVCEWPALCWTAAEVKQICREVSVNRIHPASSL